MFNFTLQDAELRSKFDGEVLVRRIWNPGRFVARYRYFPFRVDQWKLWCFLQELITAVVIDIQEADLWQVRSVRIVQQGTFVMQCSGALRPSLYSKTDFFRGTIAYLLLVGFEGVK